MDLVLKGQRWTCKIAITEIAKRRKPRVRKRSPPKPVVIQPVVIDRPVVIGDRVRMSELLRRKHPSEDTKNFKNAVGEVMGRSVRYPTCWEVLWPGNSSPWPYADRFLTVVQEPPEEPPTVEPPRPPPQKLLHLKPGELWRR